ncbi:MAG TPA: tetratricopeptide repeat protein, partial [Gemmatimonadaceae bacterium]
MKRALCAALLGFVLAPAARAQSVAVADSLLRRGSLQRAESLYYAAVRVRPRDPNARLALGRFLAGRGASRVAVTLLEEAVQFGGTAAPIAVDLAPLYLS